MAVNGAVSINSFSVNDSAFGVGDLLLRGKYRLTDVGSPVDVAPTLTFRAPTGSEADFQGLGDPVVSPGIALSRQFGMQEIHANGSVEFNTDDIQRTRARYSVGAVLHLIEPVAFVVDFLGSSSFTEDTFTQQISPRLPPNCTDVDCGFVRSVSNTRVVGFVPQTNLLDLAFGLKGNLWGSLTAFAVAIVPLNDDGVRSDGIFTGGIEATF